MSLARFRKSETEASEVMNVRKLATIAGVLLPFTVCVPALTLGQTQRSFDHFLSGLTQCEMTTEFQQFRNSLNRRVKDARGRIDHNVKVLMPVNLEKKIFLNAVEISGDGEYRKVDVPLSGTWKGLELRRITFYFGNENGIRSVFVSFNANMFEIQQRLQRDIEKGIARSKALSVKDPDLPTFDVGFTKDGGVYCDESN